MRRNCILGLQLIKSQKMKKLVLLSAFCLSILNPILSQDLKYITTVEGLKKSVTAPYSLAVWAGDFCYLASLALAGNACNVSKS